MEEATSETHVWQLFTLCFIMFISTLFVGWIPMICKFSPKKLELITIFGCGFLLGTSLIIIIPEGLIVMIEHNSTSIDNKMPDNHNHDHSSNLHSIFKKMGLSVSFGFMFMLAVEKISSPDDFHSHKQLPPSTATTTTTAANAVSSSSSSLTLIEIDQPDCDKPSLKNMFSFFIGLTMHAAIDGIALGAVSAEDQKESNLGLSIFIFTALMAHKAPAAISLSAYLKRLNQRRQQIGKYLVGFSASAPVMAMVTYYVLEMAGWGEVKKSEHLGWCLSFSGGTFLYVVTLHVLPEIKEWRDKGQLKWSDIALLTAGTVVPAFFEHSH